MIRRFLSALCIVTAFPLFAQQNSFCLSADGSAIVLKKSEKACIKQVLTGPFALMLYNALPYAAETKYVISRDCPSTETECSPLSEQEFKMGVNVMERQISEWDQNCLSITNISLSPEAELGVSLFSLAPSDNVQTINEESELLASNIKLDQLESQAMTLTGLYYYLELWAPHSQTDFIIVTDQDYKLYSIRALGNSESDKLIETDRNHYTLTLDNTYYLQIINVSLSPSTDSYFRLTDINCGTDCRLQQDGATEP
ncbi:hypothetical protein EV690_2383 [Celerinatantimonas diazotrophica]|uniref:Uncharacterized protein n=2 Tax=Celerinatantimonas diazotrophica TaxID=412034 RepID=A0A4V2PNK3_9GAMM|nr:hypothetical protein EV690_2383 [Celerinatantimonas diazotrophica]CAG9295021.1 hypothetical protein CEDIAZO_00127 [Celerinatantimonas diazotrophica]